MKLNTKLDKKHLEDFVSMLDSQELFWLKEIIDETFKETFKESISYKQKTLKKEKR